MKKSALFAAIVVTAVSSIASAATVTFTPFIVRAPAGSVTPVTITDVAGLVTTNIDETNEKTAYGTFDLNGQSIRTLGSISYDRLDLGTKTPYVNIWVTDGTHHAVIAPNVYNSYGAGGAPITPNSNGLDIQSLGVNVYETDTTNLSWLASGAVYNAAFQGLATLTGGQYTPVKVSDLFSSLTIYGNTAFGGGGATHNGTGVSILFGDTQGNFTQALPYQISNVNVTLNDAGSPVVPLPAAAWAGMALLGKLGFTRRRNAMIV